MDTLLIAIIKAVELCAMCCEVIAERVRTDDEADATRHNQPSTDSRE